MRKYLLVASMATLIALLSNTSIDAQTLQPGPDPQGQRLQLQLQQQQFQLQGTVACTTQCSSAFNACTLSCPPLGDPRASCVSSCTNAGAACGQSCTRR